MPNTKKTIKQVAINLFYRKGYFATGMSEIARDAGIRKSSIYYHYTNKEDILHDILKTTMIDLDTSLETRLRKLERAEERMRAAVENHILFHIENQREAIISDSELRGLTVKNYDVITKMRDQYEQKFQSLIKRGIEDGTFASTDFKVISYSILTMCTAVALWFRPKGRLSKEEIARIYTEFILSGLKRTDGGRRISLSKGRR